MKQFKNGSQLYKHSHSWPFLYAPVYLFSDRWHDTGEIQVASRAEKGFLFCLTLAIYFCQGTVVQSIKKHDPSYTADGFISMCIIYACLAIANWFAPAFVNFLGPRVSMIISGLTYIVFIANFLYPLTWLLYVVSVIVGVGAALIWTAQGNYLTLCSTDQTMSRNSGLFWALLQCSFLWGNIFVFTYIKTDDDGTIEKTTITVIYSVLTVLGLIGVGAFFFMGKPEGNEDTDDSNISEGVAAFVTRSISATWPWVL